MDSALLDKLNAYLISKGKPPKKLNENFVKANAKKIKPLQNLNVKKKNAIDADNSKEVEKNFKQRNPKLVKNNKENQKSSQTKKTDFSNSRNVNEKKLAAKYQEQKLPATPKAVVNIQTAKPSLAAVTTKRLIRRSMCTNHRDSPFKGRKSVAKLTPAVNKAKQICTPKIAAKRKLPVHTEKIVRKKAMFPNHKSKSPQAKRTASEEEKQQRLEQLRLWMISKGKDPNTLCGFKPTKVVLTPVQSPAKANDLEKGDVTTRWPTLREEDYCNELSVLINHTMKDARICLEKGCSAKDVHSHLLQFKEKVPVAEKHASYWLTLVKVYEKLKLHENEIISLFEKAIAFKAEPLSDVKTALKNFVEAQIEKPEEPQLEESESIGLLKSVDVVDDVAVNSTQQKASAEAVKSAVIDISPRIIATKTLPLSPLVTAESPSSVVKLRMVPRSSPIFKKIVARKALPFNVNGIVTPVRRSKRIEQFKFNYSKGLLDHDTCVANPIELVEAEKNDEELSKDFVFDPNNALGDDYSDIEKILRF